MNVDHTWLEGQVNSYSRNELPRFEIYSLLLERIMQRACDQFEILGIVNVRAKAIPSFAEKVIRKSHKYNDPIHQLTDLCGARIITLTQDETDQICRYIRDHFIVDEENSLDLRSLLKAEEFGYRSVHYVVQLRKDSKELCDVIDEMGTEECFQGQDFLEEIGDRKAEIQVRTLLQHAWAMISHDRFYKSDFEIPDQFKRELARVAALLEAADEEFGVVNQGIDEYRLDYGSYMSRDQIRMEIDKLEMVLSYDAENLNLAHRAGQLCIAIHDWGRALKILEPFRISGNPLILRDIGIVKSRSQADGIEELESAVEIDPEDATTWCALGDSYKAGNMEKAMGYYEKAFKLAPENPHILGRYLECRLSFSQSIEFIPLLFPTLDAAIERCEKLARAHVYLPSAFFDIGKFTLLQARPYRSLNAYCKAVSLCDGITPIQDALHSIESFTTPILTSLSVMPEFTDLRWGVEAVKRFLRVAIVVKLWSIMNNHSSSEEGSHRPEKLRAVIDQYIGEFIMNTVTRDDGPFIMVAGGCSEDVQEEMLGYREAINTAFECFSGTILAGGSRAGISGIIGDLMPCTEFSLRKIGYIPHHHSGNEGIHTDFEIHRSKVLHPTTWLDPEFRDFSPLEPIQAWIDLIASGIDPTDVRLLGINGGDISAFEYRMALAFGATVGVITSSGRSASELLTDSLWWGPPNLLWLPNDEMTLRAFVDPGRSSLGKDQLQRIGKVIHTRFLEENRYKNIDPAMMSWEELREDLKDSNRHQAGYAEKILRSVGWGVREITDHSDMTGFTEKEIEEMAEMEHGRWVVERLRSGWTYGPDRDPGKKISPYLSPWKDLPDEVKDYDRRAIKDYPDCFRKAGLEIYRIE